MTELEPPPVLPQTGLELPAPVARALTRFAAVTRRLMLYQAFGWVAATLLAGFIVTALLDHWVFLEDGTRRLAAVAIYLLTAGISYVLVRHALAKREAAEIALALEKCAPKDQLEERLSTTVELASIGAFNEQLSAAMVRRVADEAAERVQHLDVARLPDRKGARLALRSAGAVVALAVLLCLIPPLQMPLGLLRAALPWLNLKRTGDTSVDVATGDTRIVEGESVTIQASVTGRDIKETVLETRARGGNWITARMDRTKPDAETSENETPDKEGRTKAGFELRIGPLREKTEYRVRCADGRSETYRVDLLPRPELQGVRMLVKYPEYSGLPDQTIEKGNGDISVLKGARIELQIQANTLLAAAVLEFADDRKVSMSTKEATAACKLEIAQDTSYRVRLRSDEGVSNPEAPLFFIHALPDLPPQVMVLKPLADETASVDAVLPLECRAEDDLGVASMRLVVQTGQRREPSVIALQRPEEAGKVWYIAQPWDLSSLFLDGGGSITYRVEAVDTNGSVGKSDERRLVLTSGTKQQHSLLSAHLDEAQKRILAARKRLSGITQDVNQLRAIFRADDPEFQAAERLLLAEALNKVARDVRDASESVGKGLPYSESGPLQALLTAVSGALDRYAETGLRPLHRAAERARSTDGQLAAAGLDVAAQMLPDAEKDLSVLHEALTAGHRYVDATVIEYHANEIRQAQAQVAPVVIGSMGWSPQGALTPGLLAEYFRGINFDALVRRTVESKIDLKDAELPGMGHENFSMRWKGQVLAPKAGRYIYRVLADDGVRLTVDGKLLVDKWKSQYPTAYEAPIELTEGWHDSQLDFYQGPGGYTIKLQRSGPNTPMLPIPGMQLRHAGATVAFADARVKAVMGKAASEVAQQHALIRLQTLVGTARQLSPRYERVAALGPVPEEQGQREGADWTRRINGETADLDGVQSAAPALAPPLLQWCDQWPNWANAFKTTCDRYRAVMQQWSVRMANQTYRMASELRMLQQDAAAALQAFNQLAQTSKQPKDPKRDMDMARTDATIRALAEDLRTQAADIAGKLREDATDPKRQIDERRALQALAQKAESMARGTAADLDRRLSEAHTPEELAKSGEKTPNFGEHAAKLQQQAGELAQMTERVERALALRDALKDAEHDALAAKEEIGKAPSTEAAAAQKRAAAELKENGNQVQAAVQAAVNNVNPNALNKAAQVAQSPSRQKAAEILDKRAAETLAGEKRDPKAEAAGEKAREEAAGELKNLAKAAHEAAAEVNKDLGAFADAQNGDPAAHLREAAAEVQDAGKNAAQVPQDKPVQAGDPALAKAAHEAESARTKAEHAAEQLALKAEELHEPAAKPEAKAQADDLVRVAAAIRNEVNEKLDPAANALDQARQDPANNPALPKDLPAQAEQAAKDLNTLADIAAKVASADPNQRKQGHEALEKALAEKKIDKDIEAALKRANDLDKLAADLGKDDKAPGEKGAQGKPGPKGDAGKTEKQDGADEGKNGLDAERKALAKALGMDPQDGANEKAMGKRLDELAKELQAEADRQRQAADNLDRARGMAEQAREKAKQEGAKIANALREEGKAAGEASKQAQGKSIAAPLAGADKALPEAAQATDQQAQQADTAPLEELANNLDKIAGGLEKPLNELSAQLGQPEDAATQSAQKIGQQARQTAGKEADLAGELREAARAERLAKEGGKAASGNRKELEEQVRAALDALDKPGALPDEMEGELASAHKEASEEKAEDGGADQAGEKEDGGNEDGGKEDAAGAKGEHAAGAKKGSKGQKQGGEKGGKSGTSKEQAGQDGNGADEPGMESSSKQARAHSERMAQMAGHLQRMAQGLKQGQRGPRSSGEKGQASQTPAADAMEVMADAEAAQQTGAASQANAMKQQAAALLGQAAEAARGQATGSQTQGSNEAQMMAMADGEKEGQGEGKGKGKEQGQGKGQGQGQSKGQAQGKGQGKGQGKQAGGQQSNPNGSPQASQGGIAPNPPKGIPIDKDTWNRLPDNLRRDMLNASGERFPAEYELSIRRYFKSLATNRDESREENP
ncbi:MAG: DUF4175 family protein [Planctomycetes bacterium]|nr:DUF4175 family protein [Planctomycetota bacterium]